MPIPDIFKFSRKTFFNPSGWLDLDSVKERNRTIFTILKGLFTVPKGGPAETFEDAMQRLELSEEDVQSIAKNYRTYALVFFLLGVLVFIYSIYLLFVHATLAGLLIGFAASAVFLSQAFRYDFWSTQMRQRKLGLTIKDWKASLFNGGKG